MLCFVNRPDHRCASTSKCVLGSLTVIIEHFDGFQRIFVHILADQRQLLENVVGHSDHVTADVIRLKDIEQFARACPDQLPCWALLSDLDRLRHERHRIAAGIGDAAGKNGDKAWCATFDRIDHVLDLLQCEHGGDIQRDSVMGKLSYQEGSSFRAWCWLSGS